MYWESSAPANLALIKYVGKKTDSNIPLNASLSYTLNNFITNVQISYIPEASEDKWQSLNHKKYFCLNLSASSIDRFLLFFKFLKKTFDISGSYLIKSANNFPASAGAASSASSFCALTKATYQVALSKSNSIQQVKKLSIGDLSRLSRCGSGSSCRSFFTPWALWKQQEACAVDIPFPVLIHQFIIADTKNKLVSSSEAHKRILTSSVLEGRVQRAQTRLSDLMSALKARDWGTCFQITWDEFQDLHQLYETSCPAVNYRNQKSYNILDKVQDFWNKNKDGPLVTMDAGASVHLLYRPNQKQMAESIQKILN